MRNSHWLHEPVLFEIANGRRFNSRYQYLEYLRGRYRQRQADRRLERVSEQLIERLRAEVQRASDWWGIGEILRENANALRTLLGDPLFFVDEFNIEGTKGQDTDTHWKNRTMRMRVTMTPPMILSEQRKAHRNRRYDLGMEGREWPDIFKVMSKLGFGVGYGNIDATGKAYCLAEIAKRDFPNIHIMEVMKAPPRKQFA